MYIYTHIYIKRARRRESRRALAAGLGRSDWPLSERVGAKYW